MTKFEKDYAIRIFVDSTLTEKNLQHFYRDLMNTDKHIKFHKVLDGVSIERIYEFSRSLVKYRGEQEMELYPFTEQEDEKYDNMLLHFAKAIDEKGKSKEEVAKEWLKYVLSDEKEAEFEKLMENQKHQNFHKIINKYSEDKICSFALGLMDDRLEQYKKGRPYTKEQKDNYDNWILHFAEALKEKSMETELFRE